MPTPHQPALVWFRRDLRDYDHAALYQALKSSQEVYCVFVFDTGILDRLRDRSDRRVEFIRESVDELKQALQQRGADLIVRHGPARELIPQLARELGVAAVYVNHDYEPAAVERDAQVADSLASGGIALHSCKDQVIFERDEVLTQAGNPYGVFTPYKHAWLKKLNDFYLRPYPVDRYAAHLANVTPTALPSLESLGFEHSKPSGMPLPTGMSGARQLFADFIERMPRYQAMRDFPAVKGPSYLSVHLRFGTISIRQLARAAWQMGGAGAETWLSELIWRDFYFQTLYHHPRIAAGHAYQPAFDTLAFPNDESLFQAWCAGLTGYPLVDAAMRQLNQSGWMHNRLRMLTASFLVKDLLIDWRHGERYFAEKLLDFDFSANNGGWQWAASTGCDAQPWFRIFNPVTQSKKFDPEGKFIRKYVPELADCSDTEIHAPWLLPPTRRQALGIGTRYPLAIVDHAAQRAKTLALYRPTGGSLA